MYLPGRLTVLIGDNRRRRAGLKKTEGVVEILEAFDCLA
jgi:hypothetical protein